MDIWVQKYGGTSLATTRHIQFVAEKIANARRKNPHILVVASAMGHSTDELVQKAKEVLSFRLPPQRASRLYSLREMDMLLSSGEQVSVSLLCLALHSRGIPAVSFTGAQAGLYTDAVYGRARVVSIRAGRILQALSRRQVVVVAGFQGITRQGDITTLGRGGSDTTAVALAVTLGAERCEIYTDVDGVYTADPRVVPEARCLSSIFYDEMLEMANLGAQVLHPRSVELAKTHNVRLVVKSTFKGRKGTDVCKEKTMEKENPVRGVTCDQNVAKISLVSVPDRPGIASKIFGALAKANINVDMIIQNVTRGAVNDISFTVSRQDLDTAVDICKKVGEILRVEKVLFDKKTAKVSIVGVGMISRPGVAARMFSALAKQHINIDMISTSEIRISCLIHVSQASRAVRSLHHAFGLSKKKREA